MSASSLDAEPLPFAATARGGSRAQALLDGVWRVAWPGIGAALEQGLGELDTDLFRHAERAPSVNEQNLCFESLRELRGHREAFLAACRDGAQRSLHHLLDADVPVDTLRTAEPGTRRRSELKLVDPVHLEEVLVLTEVATRAEMRASEELQAWSYRLAMILGTAPAEHDALALGPHRLCASIRVAADCFDIVLAHRHALYRRFDRSLFGDAASLYAAINRYLAGENVLAHLRLTPRRVQPRSDGPRPVPAVAIAAPVAAHPPATPAWPDAPADPPPHPLPGPRSPAAPCPTAQVVALAAPAPASVAPPGAAAVARAEAAPAHPPSVEGPAMLAFRRFLEANPREANPREATPPARPAGAPAAASAAPADAPDFETLRQLLEARRRAAGETSPAPAPGAHPGELHAVLCGLQRRVPEPVLVDGRPRPRAVADLKREVLAHLRARGDGAAARLSAADADAIDLIGHLFDHLAGERGEARFAQELLVRLQVPLLRVALQDKRFFSERSHPARQLLDALLETSDTWVDEEDGHDHAAADRLRAIVDRLAREFGDDPGVFAQLGEDVQKQLGGLRRKAEVAERHHVEAARGRERLELAKAAAADTVRERLRQRILPQAVRALLESAWSDVIALAILRLGREHPGTRARIDFVDLMARLFGGGLPPAERRFGLERLHAAFAEGLRSIGYHEDAVALAWKDLAKLAEEGGDETQAARVQELVGHQPRLGGERRDVAPREPAHSVAAAPRPEVLPVGPREAEMIERIRHLPFGTWMEFTLNQQGDRARRKLCWYSPVTGHCLFVNARGAKVGERSIEDLARDLLRGNVRVLEEVRESLVDRAWRSIVAMLRGGAAGTPASSH